MISVLLSECLFSLMFERTAGLTDINFVKVSLLIPILELKWKVLSPFTRVCKKYVGNGIKTCYKVFEHHFYI